MTLARRAGYRRAAAERRLRRHGYEKDAGEDESVMSGQESQQVRANRPVLAGIAISALSAFYLGGILSLVPAHSQGDDDRFFMHLHTERAMANVTVLPARVGPVDITIQLETTDETPLAAKALFVTLANEKSGTAPQTAEAERSGDDQWLLKMSAPLAGRWMLGLGITLPNFDRLDVESPIIIK
jgi:copper transport protein